MWNNLWSTERRVSMIERLAQSMCLNVSHLSFNGITFHPVVLNDIGYWVNRQWTRWLSLLASGPYRWISFTVIQHIHAGVSLVLEVSNLREIPTLLLAGSAQWTIQVKEESLLSSRGERALNWELDTYCRPTMWPSTKTVTLLPVRS